MSIWLHAKKLSAIWEISSRK